MAVIKQPTKIKKHILIPAILIASLLAAGTVLFIRLRHHQASVSAPTAIKPDSKIDLSPPTTEDLANNDANKDRIVTEGSTPPAPPPAGGSKQVSPTVNAAMYEGNLEVAGFVSGVFEDGGTCTITATKGSVTVTKQVTGLKNVSTTQCPSVSIPKAELSNGTWSVVIKYASASSHGTSEPQQVEVN